MYYTTQLEERIDSQARDEIQDNKRILDQYIVNNGHTDTSKTLPLTVGAQYEITQAFAIVNQRSLTTIDLAEIIRFWLKRTMLERNCNVNSLY